MHHIEKDPWPDAPTEATDFTEINGTSHVTVLPGGGVEQACGRIATGEFLEATRTSEIWPLSVECRETPWDRWKGQADQLREFISLQTPVLL